MAAESQTDSIRPRDWSIHRPKPPRFVGLSILFLIVYGGCNWIYVAARANVRHILFRMGTQNSVRAVFHLPYMSIDLFFVAAPFLCRSERELSIFTSESQWRLWLPEFVFAFSTSLAFPRPQRRRLARRESSMVSRNGAPYNLLRRCTLR